MFELAVVAIAALTTAGYYVRSDLAHYSILSFGESRRVKRTSVRREGHSCQDCGCDIQIGERRDYYKTAVVAGSEVFRYARGTARYCYDHADIGIRDELEPVESFDNIPWFMPLLVCLQSPIERDDVDRKEFANAVSSARIGFELVPIAIVVLIATLVVGFIRQIGASE